MNFELAKLNLKKRKIEAEPQLRFQNKK